MFKRIKINEHSVIFAQIYFMIFVVRVFGARVYFYLKSVCVCLCALWCVVWYFFFSFFFSYALQLIWHSSRFYLCNINFLLSPAFYDTFFTCTTHFYTYKIENISFVSLLFLRNISYETLFTRKAKKKKKYYGFLLHCSVSSVQRNIYRQQNQLNHVQCSPLEGSMPPKIAEQHSVYISLL